MPLKDAQNRTTDTPGTQEPPKKNTEGHRHWSHHAFPRVPRSMSAGTLGKALMLESLGPKRECFDLGLPAVRSLRRSAMMLSIHVLNIIMFWCADLVGGILGSGRLRFGPGDSNVGVLRCFFRCPQFCSAHPSGIHHRIRESLGPKPKRYGSKDTGYGSPYDRDQRVMDLRIPTTRSVNQNILTLSIHWYIEQDTGILRTKTETLWN